MHDSMTSNRFLQVIKGVMCVSAHVSQLHRVDGDRERADERLLNAGLPPALQSGPGNLLHVGLSSSVSMEEAATTVPGLQFPRRQRWQKSPVLELNLGQVPITGMQLHISLHGRTHTPD